MVVVEKANRESLRICLDPKDLNQAIHREHYRTRRLTYILPKLKEAQFFDTCDARSDYWSIKLDKPSSLLTTFNTRFSRSRFFSLPFGLVSLQDIFKRRLIKPKKVLKGLNQLQVTYVYRDTGRTNMKSESNAAQIK